MWGYSAGTEFDRAMLAAIYEPEWSHHHIAISSQDWAWLYQFGWVSSSLVLLLWFPSPASTLLPFFLSHACKYVCMHVCIHVWNIEFFSFFCGEWTLFLLLFWLQLLKPFIFAIFFSVGKAIWWIGSLWGLVLGGGHGYAVWQKLEEQNPEFFKAYYTRLKLKKQIMLFNHLLEQQVQLMHKMSLFPAKPPLLQNGMFLNPNTSTTLPLLFAVST